MPHPDNSGDDEGPGKDPVRCFFNCDSRLCQFRNRFINNITDEIGENTQRKPSRDRLKSHVKKAAPPMDNTMSYFKPNAKPDPTKTGALPVDIAAATGQGGDCIGDTQLKLLQHMEEFHGFLPREDLSFLLKKVGDYVIRVSEVDKEVGAGTRWELILSIAIEKEKDEGAEKSTARKIDVKNVIIRNELGVFYLSAGSVFQSIGELIEHYKANTGNINKAEFRLKCPIALQPWEFRHKQITLGKVLGSGAFGEVRLGVLEANGTKTPVAVKVTKGIGEMPKTKIKEMMREARLLRNIKHDNIVVTHGVSVDEHPLMIIMELVDGGALNSYLKKNIGQVDGDKLSFCLGAARGVAFLHENKIMHRDLAARNCLITKSKLVKVSDFGMSKQGRAVYKMKKAAKLPIRWLAPESLKSFIFTYKTDVFSYGVVMYEIYVDGKEPWPGKNHLEVKKAVLGGTCLDMPPNTPAGLKDFIQKKIFNPDPEQRAEMAEVATFLENFKEG